jgi:hypothetical protein
LRLLGQAPRHVVLVGVQPATIGLGTQLSPAVAGALPAVSAEVVRQLDRWTSVRGATSTQATQSAESRDATISRGATETSKTSAA